MNVKKQSTAEVNAVLLVKVLLGTNTAIWGLENNRLLLFLVGIVVLLVVTGVVVRQRLAVVKREAAQKRA